MIDLVMALWGGKHCGWCNFKRAWWWERWTGLARATGPSSTWPRHTRWASRWATFHSEKIPIWRLAESWHYHHHVVPRRRNDPPPRG